MWLQKANFFTILIGLIISCGASELIEKPIIGILSTPSDFRDLYSPQDYSYIKGSYAEFIEAANGIPIAIPWNLPERELVNLLDSINGILFTGGDAHLWKYDETINDIVFNEFTERTSFILRYALHLNDKGVHFPVFGICQGHEVIAMGIAERPHVIDHYKHPVQLDTVEITKLGKTSRMFQNMPDHLTSFIKEVKSMFYNHQYGFNTSLLIEQSVLNDFFVITATGVDNHGKEFIAALEAKNYPIYTVQYHPERVLSEWLNKAHFSHPDEAAEAIIFQANFFVNEARKNQQKFLNEVNFKTFLLKNQVGKNFNLTWPNVYFYETNNPLKYVLDLEWLDDVGIDQPDCIGDHCDVTVNYEL